MKVVRLFFYAPYAKMLSDFVDYIVHPHLHFVSHFPMTILGEQLMAQFFRAIPEKQWLFKWGRVPMSTAMHEWAWQVRPHIELLSSVLTLFAAYIRRSR